MGPCTALPSIWKLSFALGRARQGGRDREGVGGGHVAGDRHALSREGPRGERQETAVVVVVHRRQRLPEGRRERCGSRERGAAGRTARHGVRKRFRLQSEQAVIRRAGDLHVGDLRSLRVEEDLQRVGVGVRGDVARQASPVTKNVRKPSCSQSQQRIVQVARDGEFPFAVGELVVPS